MSSTPEGPARTGSCTNSETWAELEFPKTNRQCYTLQWKRNQFSGKEPRGSPKPKPTQLKAKSLARETTYLLQEEFTPRAKYDVIASYFNSLTKTTISLQRSTAELLHEQGEQGKQRARRGKTAPLPIPSPEQGPKATATLHGRENTP